MNSRYTIMPDQSIIHLEISGELTANDFIAGMERIHRDPRFKTNQNMLIDMGRSQPANSVAESLKIADYVRKLETVRGPCRWAFITLNPRMQDNLDQLINLSGKTAIELDHFAFLNSGLRWARSVPAPLPETSRDTVALAS